MEDLQSSIFTTRETIRLSYQHPPPRCTDTDQSQNDISRLMRRKTPAALHNYRRCLYGFFSYFEFFIFSIVTATARSVRAFMFARVGGYKLHTFLFHALDCSSEVLLAHTPRLKTIQFSDVVGFDTVDFLLESLDRGDEVHYCHIMDCEEIKSRRLFVKLCRLSDKSTRPSHSETISIKENSTSSYLPCGL